MTHDHAGRDHYLCDRCRPGGAGGQYGAPEVKDNLGWGLKIGLYAMCVTGVFVVFTIALPAVWVVDKAAGAYRKLTT